MDLSGIPAVVFENDDTKVSGFSILPGDGTLINGGFMVFEQGIFDYLKDDTTILEQEPFRRLTEDGEMAGYCHKGFWQCMDTQREKKRLEELWQSGKAPWKIW